MSGGASPARAGGYRPGCPSCVRAVRRDQPACPRHYVPVRGRVGGHGDGPAGGGGGGELVAGEEQRARTVEHGGGR